MDTKFKKGNIPWNKGLKASDNEKIAKSVKKMYEARKLIGGPNKGKKFPKWWREKLSDAHKGVKLSEYHLKRRSEGQKGLKKSMKWRIKMSKSCRIGENNHFWKGGVAKITIRLRKTVEYRIWRDLIYKRDNYKCVLCGSNKRLEVDHIIPFSKIMEENNIKSFEQGIECNQLWDINNGRVLCHECHIKTPTFGFNGLNKKKP